MPENKPAVLSCCFYLFLFCTVSVLSACAVKPTVPSEKTSVPERPVVQAPVRPEIPTPVKKPEPRRHVAILLSADVGVYRGLADALNKKLDVDTQVYALSGDGAKNSNTLTKLQSPDHTHLVAIGLEAARALSTVENKPVIFAYVLNYNDHNLIRSNMKGVSMLPGAEQLFKDWKAISPQIRRVAVISGPKLDDYIDYANREAARHNIVLDYQVVKTDKEFLYRSKKLASDTQGQWIIPDNRVLSRKALKEVLSYNARGGKQTVVFSPQLLDLGGLFYSRISHDEVIDGIVRRLQDCEEDNTISGEDVIFLRHHEMGINSVVAHQLGIKIPAAYSKYLSQ